MSDCQRGAGSAAGQAFAQLGQGGLGGLQAQGETKTAKVELTLEELPNSIRYRAEDLERLRAELDAISARIRGFGSNAPTNPDEKDVPPVQGDTLLIKAELELDRVTEEIQMVRERVQLIYGLLFPG